jgi:hypothetical protein
LSSSSTCSSRLLVMIRALNVAGLSEVEKRVVKATYDDDDPPKPKHVEALILLSTDHDLLPYLDKRIISLQWNVCVKTMIVMHKLMMEGDERWLTELSSSPSLFSLPQSFDLTTDPTASSHTAFIHAYALYLQSKVDTFRALKVSSERSAPSDSAKWAMKLTANQVTHTLPSHQQQLDRLIQCTPRNTQDIHHPIIIAAMQCCIKYTPHHTTHTQHAMTP